MGGHVNLRNFNVENFLCRCCFCGNYWIVTRIIRCPFCNGGDIVSIPFGRDKMPGHTLNYHWLKEHGFPYIKERLEVDIIC